MRFKRIAAAVAFAVCAAFALTGVVFAENTQEPNSTVSDTEQGDFSGDLSALLHGYSEDMMMEQYAFPDGAAFYSSEVLSEEENVLSMLALVTEEDDVSIKVTRNGETLPEQTEYLIGDAGSYKVTVSHVMRNGAGTVEVCFAADIKNSSSSSAEQEIVEGRVSLEKSENGYFCHTFFEGSVLSSNVLDGETVSVLPILVIPESVMCSLYKDGKSYPMPSSEIITEDGAYSAEFSCVDDEGNRERRFMAFSVFTQPTNRLGIYQPPSGFEITGVKLNGSVLPIDNADYVLLDGQGEYSIEYSNGTVYRSASFVRDTLPPVLYFNGTSDVVFKDRVIVSSSEECTYSVKQNGQLIGGAPELNGAGNFRVTATDAAGNTVEVRVEIMPVSAISPLDFVIIFGVLALAAALYFVIQKNTRIKVR